MPIRKNTFNNKQKIVYIIFVRAHARKDVILSNMLLSNIVFILYANLVYSDVYYPK